jgi:molecular chaperone DnaJ
VRARRDYYEILGVDRGSDSETIKRAYRRLAMRYHPDRNPGDAESEERFKECREAFDVLSDPDKRRLYDAYGPEGLETVAGAGGFGFDFGDVFGSLFEQVFRAAGGEETEVDLAIRWSIGLEEAYRGGRLRVRYQALDPCPKCRGSGTRPGTGLRTCPRCAGAGVLRLRQGFFTVQQTCPDCRGRGRVVEAVCPDCRGEGRRPAEREIEIDLPPGIEDGARFRVRDAGHAHAHGRGHLLLEIAVRPHDVFRREGDDLLCTVPVGFPTLALGGTLEIMTFEGGRPLEVPAGTQSGEELRIPGAGMPRRQGGRGDLRVRLEIETPRTLDEEQRRLLRAFEATLEEKHQPRLKRFNEQLRNFFARKERA